VLDEDSEDVDDRLDVLLDDKLDRLLLLLLDMLLVLELDDSEDVDSEDVELLDSEDAEDVDDDDRELELDSSSTQTIAKSPDGNETVCVEKFKTLLLPATPLLVLTRTA
jgi:hypothetical protein